MDEQERLKCRVAEAVTAFQREQMSLAVEAAWVDFHPGFVVVTTRGAVCPAEQRCAQDKEARDLIQRLYSDLFDSCKGLIERQIEEILGRPVTQSRLSVDPESGDHIVFFACAAEACQERDASDSDDLGTARN